MRELTDKIKGTVNEGSATSSSRATIPTPQRGCRAGAEEGPAQSRASEGRDQQPLIRLRAKGCGCEAGPFRVRASLLIACDGIEDQPARASARSAGAKLNRRATRPDLRDVADEKGRNWRIICCRSPLGSAILRQHKYC